MSLFKTNCAAALPTLPHTTTELVHRALEGDSWAEETLYRNHVHGVTNFCLRMIRSRVDTEDVVQETFVQAFRKLHTLREPEKFQSWLTRISYNHMQQLFRQKKRTFNTLLRDDLYNTPLEEQVVSDATQEQRTEIALLDTAFDQMKDEERACWVLRYLERYRIKEIVKITGLSKNTVKRRIAAAQDTVNSHFGESIHE
jgi:RNA polymerase sigma-70 factor, ECF subfamily